MSGRSAMAVVAHHGLIGECDERINDVCLAFAEVFVRMAAGVIAGAKPAAIFSIPMRAYAGGRWRHLVRHALDEALRAYAAALPTHGVSLSVLYRTEKRVYLLVWRPELLERVLADDEALAILREAGYVGTTAEELARELRRRLVAYYCDEARGTEFPHEIGVFLGYPTEDVRGYLAGLPVTCRGPWQAYGDERLARQRFRALERVERGCRLRFAAGESLGALFAA